jgi:hypothetical protein
MKDVQIWIEQVIIILQQRLSKALEPATEHGFNAEDVWLASRTFLRILLSVHNQRKQ